MSNYVAKINGEFVTPGDYIRDYRDLEWIFGMVTRGTEYNGTAKVLVYCTNESGTSREFYHHVFPGLVIEACEKQDIEADIQRLLDKPKHH